MQNFAAATYSPFLEIPQVDGRAGERAPGKIRLTVLTCWLVPEFGASPAAASNWQSEVTRAYAYACT